MVQSFLSLQEKYLFFLDHHLKKRCTNTIRIYNRHLLYGPQLPVLFCFQKPARSFILAPTFILSNQIFFHRTVSKTKL